MAARGTLAWVAEGWARGLTRQSPLKAGYYARMGAPPTRALIAEDGKLWSRGEHYMLAQLIEHKGKTVALINTDHGRGGDTPSTCNHRGAAYTAAYNKGYEVLFVSALPLNPSIELKARLEEAIDTYNFALRRRDPWSIAHSLDSAAHELGRARKLADLFDLEFSPDASRFKPIPDKIKAKAVADRLTSGNTALADAIQNIEKFTRR